LTFTTAAAWVHLLLIAVGCLWVWASVALVRDVIRAVRRGDGTRSGSWSHQWAASIVGLVLTITAGSAVTTTLALHPGRQPTANAPRTLADRPPSQPTSARSGETPREATVQPGECLDGFAARVTGERGRWPEIARANLGSAQPTGGRFVDPSLLRSGWCLTVPAAVTGSSPGGVEHTRSIGRTVMELDLLGLGVLMTGAVARRVRALRRLTESARSPNTRLDRQPTDVVATEVAIGPCGDGLLVDWIEAALRLARWRPDGAVNATTTPDIRLVRAGPDGIELLLGTAHPSPPPPMTTVDGGKWWTLSANELGEAATLAPKEGRIVPWLVPVGEDTDAVYLLAIGPGSHLVVEGAPAVRAAAIRGMVAGLRALPWATELAVELLGVHPPPPAERCFQLFASSVATLRQLAIRGCATDRLTVRPAWRPEPLVVALGTLNPPGHDSGGLDDRLLSEVLAVAGVVSDRGDGTDRLVIAEDGSARLLPYGIALSTPLPTAEQSRLLDRLLASAAATVTLAVDLLATPSPVRRHPSTTIGPVDLTLLAGPPSVRGVPVEPAPRDLDRVVELLAFLVLHDHQASIGDVANALFARETPDGLEQRVHHVLAAARALLPHGGDERPLLSTGSGGAITLDRAVTSDWGRISSAITTARAATPDQAIAWLSRAFEGVQAAPILNDMTTYGWMVREGIAASIRADMVDAAHHLATLAIAADAVEEAGRAIDHGLAIDPISEILVRDAMTLRDRLGDATGVNALYESLEGALDALTSAEPSSETRALFRALTDPAR
jgi:DNA-binding SARP family transcriptional activator